MISVAWGQKQVARGHRLPSEHITAMKKLHVYCKNNHIPSLLASRDISQGVAKKTLVVMSEER